jgi:hypothetical protein
MCMKRFATYLAERELPSQGPNQGVMAPVQGTETAEQAKQMSDGLAEKLKGFLSLTNIRRVIEEFLTKYKPKDSKHLIQLIKAHPATQNLMRLVQRLTGMVRQNNESVMGAMGWALKGIAKGVGQMVLWGLEGVYKILQSLESTAWYLASFAKYGFSVHAALWFFIFILGLFLLAIGAPTAGIPLGLSGAWFVGLWMMRVVFRPLLKWWESHKDGEGSEDKDFNLIFQDIDWDAISHRMMYGRTPA